MKAEEKEQKALQFATEAHGSQMRKYHKEPYIEHPKRVAEKVKEVPHTPEMICAALLHDVVEDTPISLSEIENKFGKEVAKLVEELTDEFIKQKYPHLNRKARKEKETERLGKISDKAKTIKLADIIDNTPDISLNDPGFARRYVPEMLALLKVLKGGDDLLYAQALEEVKVALNRLPSSSKKNY